MRKELAIVLEQNGIDTTSLMPLFVTSQETCYYISVPGVEAINCWHKLRSLVEQTGFWPVVLGDERQLNWYLATDFSNHSIVSEIVETGLAIDPVKWFDQKWQKLLEQEEYYPPRGELWPNVKGVSDFIIPIDTIKKRPFDTVYLALVPTKISWQIPAFLRFGGYNECPAPETHVAILRYWTDIYGIELVGNNIDIIEVKVAHPPIEKEQALKLAEEQYLYCTDIVEQGTGTIEALASILLNNHIWFFWWD